MILREHAIISFPSEFILVLIHVIYNIVHSVSGFMLQEFITSFASGSSLLLLFIVQKSTGLELFTLMQNEGGSRLLVMMLRVDLRVETSYLVVAHSTLSAKILHKPNHR